MASSEKEVLATLKLLAAMAKADGTISPEEREVFTLSLTDVKLPAGVTSKTLLDGTYDVAALATEVTSQEARDAAFSSLFTMCYADGYQDKAELAILSQVEKAWTVPKAQRGILTRLFDEAKDTVSMTRITPIADPLRRKKEIDEDIVKYSVLAAVLGLNPIPVVSIATDLAVVGLQGKMFRDIGQYWGRETSKEATKQVLAGIGVGTGARIAVNGVAKLVPGLGSAFAASTNFASTWALGQVANTFWEHGGKGDGKSLRDLFRSSESEGKKHYLKYKAEVDAKRRANAKALDQLAADYKSGKLTQPDYEKAVAAMK